MRALFRRAIFSPTFTTMLVQTVSPLRLLLLTPLVLNRFGKTELDVFYLIASANIPFMLLRGRINDTFTKMLSYAFGGASSFNTGAFGSNDKNDSNQPNWDLFERCYRTLGWLMLVCILPAAIISAVLSIIALGQLTDWSFHPHELWLAMLISIIGNGLNMQFDKYQNAMLAAGRIVRYNQISSIIQVGTVLVGAAVVLVGGGLVSLVLSQTVMAFLYPVLLFRSNPMTGRKKYRKAGVDRDIIRHAWSPLWRGFIGSMSTVGAQRGLGIFLAATGIPGFTAVFLLTQNVFQTMGRLAGSLLVSQYPRFANLLAKGREGEMVEDALGRAFVVFGAQVIGVICFAFAGPFLMDLIGASIQLLPFWQMVAFGVLLAVVTLIFNFGAIYNVTNRMIFYKRNAVASVLVIAMCFLGVFYKNYWVFIVAATVPYLLTLNVYTFKKMVELSGLERSILVDRAMARSLQILTKMKLKHG